MPCPFFYLVVGSLQAQAQAQHVCNYRVCVCVCVCVRLKFIVFEVALNPNEIQYAHLSYLSTESEKHILYLWPANMRFKFNVSRASSGQNATARGYCKGGESKASGGGSREREEVGEVSLTACQVQAYAPQDAAERRSDRTVGPCGTKLRQWQQAQVQPATIVN